MIELTSLVKECVSAVTKTADNIFVYMNQYEMWICLDRSIMAYVDLRDEMIPLSHNLSFVYNPGTEVTDDEKFHNKYIEDIMMEYINQFGVQLNCYTIVAQNENLRSDPGYEDLLARKASDGAKFYILPGNDLYTNYMIPVFTGLPNVSKTDSIGIKVWKNISISEDVLIVEYDISKKKIKRDVVLFFRTVDLNRPLYGETW